MNDNSERGLKAAISYHSDGRIDSIRVIRPNGTDVASHYQSKLFTVKEKGNKLVVREAEVPPYLYAGYPKRLDIRNDWNAAFRGVADSVRDDSRTFLDYDRLYTLWQMVKNVANSDLPIIEVGVYRGGSSAFIAQAQRNFGKNGRIYACDTFRGHTKIDDDVDGTHLIGSFGEDTSYKEVKTYLKPYPEVEVVKGDILKTLKTLPDSDFAALHLDVDVIIPTRFALENVAPRLIVGGIIVVDDYAVTSCPGVKLAVDEFAEENPNFVVSHLLSAQATLVKVR